MECTAEFDLNGDLMYHTTFLFNGSPCGLVISKYRGTYNCIDNGIHYNDCEKYSIMIYSISYGKIQYDFYKIGSNQWTDDDYKKLYLITTDTRKYDHNCDYVKVIISNYHIIIKDNNKLHIYAFNFKLLQQVTITNTITRIKISNNYLIIENTDQKDGGKYTQLNEIYEIDYYKIQHLKTLETPILFINSYIIITLKSDGQYSYNIQDDIYNKIDGHVLHFKNNICHVETNDNKIKLYYFPDKKRKIDYTYSSEDDD